MLGLDYKLLKLYAGAMNGIDWGSYRSFRNYMTQLHKNTTYKSNLTSSTGKKPLLHVQQYTGYRLADLRSAGLLGKVISSLSNGAAR